MRVVGAIAMREIKSQRASMMYGYAWVLIDLALSILGLLILRVVIKGFTPLGVPPATFILSGMLPWTMFSALYHQQGNAINKGAALRAFPVITTLDCAIGVSIYTFVTYSIVLVASTTVSSIIEQVPFPHFPLGIMLIVFGMWLLGVGFGFVFMLLSYVWSPITNFLAVALRMMVFLSSVIMPITKFPAQYWPYLTWNPLLHAEELLRQYWFPSYVSPVGKPIVIIAWAFGLLAFGLVCERYVRTRYAK